MPSLGGAQPAGPPAGAGPGRRAARGRRRGHADPVGLRLRGRRPGSRVPADVRRAGRVLVSGPAARRHLPQPAGQAGRGSSLDGTKVSVTCGAARFTLLTMPVEDYPTLPDMPDGHRHGRRRRLRQAVAQVAVAAGRDDTLPVLTGVRIEIEGDDDHAAGHRPLPARPARARPGRPRPPTQPGVALVPARTLADTAKSLAGRRRGRRIALGRRRRRRGHDRLRGPAAADVRRPGCSTASSRRSARSSPPSTRHATPSSTPPTLIEAVKRVALVAERNTPVRLRVHRRQVDPRGRLGDEAQASEAIEATLDGRGHRRSRSTRSSCSTASARSTTPYVAAVVHRSPASRRSCAVQSRARTARRTTATATC